MLCCGLATLDVVQTVDHVPAADQKVQARGLAVSSGGPAANAAVTAATLGCPATLVTRAGGSVLGRLVVADLEAHGVAVRDLGGADDAPAVSTVLVTAGTGERAVVSVNAALAPHGAALSDAEAAVTGAAVLLVDGHHLDLATRLARAARAAGVPVLLDGGSWKPGLEALLALTDVALLSADFRLPGPGDGRAPDALAAVAALGPRLVARSRGGAAIQVHGADDVAVPPVAVVDTLGAGDVLHGALAAWLAHHGARDAATLRQGLAFAARVASASCAADGARGWQRDADVVHGARSALTRDV